jgi:hypothetical protein
MEGPVYCREESGRHYSHGTGPESAVYSAALIDCEANFGETTSAFEHTCAASRATHRYGSGLGELVINLHIRTKPRIWPERSSQGSETGWMKSIAKGNSRLAASILDCHMLSLKGKSTISKNHAWWHKLMETTLRRI